MIVIRRRKGEEELESGSATGPSRDLKSYSGTLAKVVIALLILVACIGVAGGLILNYVL